MDNLSKHAGTWLQQAFCPSEGIRVLAKLEIHGEIKRGSQPNTAEIERPSSSKSA